MGASLRLRDYQRSFIAGIHRQYANGRKAPLAVLPTGGGKTACLAYIADSTAEKNLRSAITVHRQELVLQTSLTLARADVWHRIVAPDPVIKAAIQAMHRELGRSRFNSEAPNTVASIQALVRRPDERFDFLNMDEAHHSVAGSWQTVIARNPDAWLLGVTATAERLDGRGLGTEYGGPFDSLVLGPSTADLIADGYLSPPRVYAPAQQLDFSDVHTLAGDFKRDEAAAKMDKPTITGDAIDHYRRLCDGIPAIAFCTSVDHAKHVAESFAAAGYRARCVDGGMNDADRRAAIAALGRGDIHVLTSCEIISEGVDVPVVGAAILLRPTKSLGLYLQQVGRVLRPYPGKENALVLDHVGNSLRHGMPDDPREWSLAGRRKRGQRDTESALAARQCMNCYAIFSATLNHCPACGAAYVLSAREIEQVDGELVEIDAAAAARARQQAKFERLREQDRARSEADLIALAKQRGYEKPEAWARVIMRARRKRAPRLTMGV